MVIPFHLAGKWVLLNKVPPSKFSSPEITMRKVTAYTVSHIHNTIFVCDEINNSQTAVKNKNKKKLKEYLNIFKEEKILGYKRYYVIETNVKSK